MNYQVGICDDDEVFLDKLKQSLRKYEQANALLLQIVTYKSGNALLDDYQNHHYNLLVLDVDMPGLNGIEVAQKLRVFDKDVAILYSTIHDDFAREAFQVDATSYLTKPLTDEQLFAKFDLIFKHLALKLKFHNFDDKYLSLTARKKTLHLPYSEILYMTKQRNILTFHTMNGNDFLYTSLKNVRKHLDSSIFVKINAGEIVNWQKITGIHDTLLCIEDIELTISRKYATQIHERYCQENMATILKRDQEV